MKSYYLNEIICFFKFNNNDKTRLFFFYKEPRNYRKFILIF